MAPDKTKTWQECEDSNPGPAVLETAALPTELHSYAQQIIVHYIIFVQDYWDNLASGTLYIENH